MPAITLDPIAGAFASAAALNDRFQIIEDVINNNVLFRTYLGGYAPDSNVFNIPVDMNLQTMLNLPAPLYDSSPVRLADVKAALESALGMVPITIPVQIGDGVTTDFITVASWFDDAGVHRVSIDGQVQAPNADYTISDAATGVLTFTSPPANNARIDIVAFAPNVAPPGGGSAYANYFVLAANTDYANFQALDASVADTFDFSNTNSATTLYKVGRIDGGYVGKRVRFVFDYSYTTGGTIYSALYDLAAVTVLANPNIDLPASMTSFPSSSSVPMRTHLPAVVTLVKCYDGNWRLQT